MITSHGYDGRTVWIVSPALPPKEQLYWEDSLVVDSVMTFDEVDEAINHHLETFPRNDIQFMRRDTIFQVDNVISAFYHVKLIGSRHRYGGRPYYLKHGPKIEDGVGGSMLFNSPRGAILYIHNGFRS